MDDLTEDRLRDDLARCATYAAPTAPPVDALIRSGHAAARHGRTRWVVAGAAAAVAAVAVVVAVVNGGSGASPDPTPPVVSPPSSTPTSPHTPAPNPEAAPPRVAYILDRVLHLGTDRIPVRGSLLSSAGGTAVLEETWSRVGRVITVHRGTTTTRIGASTNALRQGVSPAGRYVWLAEQGPTAAAVTVWDAEDGTKLGARQIPSSFSGPTGGGGDLEIVGVDDSGRLFWEVLGADRRTLFMARDPGAPAQEVRGLGDEWWPPTLTTAGLQVRGSLLSSRFGNETGTPYVTALVGPGGGWGECDDTSNCIMRGGRAPGQASYSPNGEYGVFREPEDAQVDSGLLRIVGPPEEDLLPYAVIDLGLPDGASHERLRFVGWEDDDTFLLVESTPLSGQLVLRCEAADGACAVVIRADRERYQFAEDPLVR